VVARNIRVGRDEVDLLVRLGGALVAVEVKTRIGGDPAELFVPAKAARLRRAAARLGAARCDLITVRMDRRGAGIRWIPGVC
jgi:Holliday junction resolvase-like predicted endonuclease